MNSKIIIGCMSWGKWGKNFSTSAMADLLSFCVQEGNKTFDHADLYGDYTTETEFGKALKESGIERNDVKIITKCGIQNPGENRNNPVKHYDYSKDYIIWSAENSLKNLQTDYLDTFLLHRPSPLLQIEEVAKAINKLKTEGKIKRFGVSNFSPQDISLLKTMVKVDVNQIEFSLTQHSAMHNGTLSYMQQHEIDFMSWSPLGSFFKEKNEQSSRIKSTLETLCVKYNADEDTILLCWILKHPAKVSPVIGTTNKDRIKNANKALKIDLDLIDWFTLLEAATGNEVP